MTATATRIAATKRDEAKPATRRINHGRGHSYLLDGEKPLSVSNIKDMLPKPALVKWAAEMAAAKVVDDWDAIEAMKPSERYKALVKAPYEGRDKAAARGTEVHGYAEKLISGAPLNDVPEHMRGYAEAAVRFMDDFEVEAIAVEFVLFSRRFKWGGTGDLLATLLAKRGRSRRVLAAVDYKTSQSGIWPETALQLALYAGADFYLGPEGEEIPMPPVDAMYGVHLREDGTYSRVPVIADPAWLVKTGRYLQQIHRFQETPRSEIFGPADEG